MPAAAVEKAMTGRSDLKQAILQRARAEYDQAVGRSSQDALVTALAVQALEHLLLGRKQGHGVPGSSLK